MKRKDYLEVLLGNTRRALECPNDSIDCWCDLNRVMDKCIEDLENRGEEVFGGDSHYITDPDPEFDFQVLERCCENIGALVEVPAEREYEKDESNLLSVGTIVKLGRTLYACNCCYAIVPSGPRCPECEKGYVQVYINKGTNMTITDHSWESGKLMYTCDEYDDKGNLVRDSLTLKASWLKD